MRIWFPDPHWKKMDSVPDPGHFLKIFWNILTKQNFQMVCLIFSLIFMLKFDESFRNQNFFYNLFFNGSDLGLESKPDPKH